MWCKNTQFFYQWSSEITVPTWISFSYFNFRDDYGKVSPSVSALLPGGFDDETRRKLFDCERLFRFGFTHAALFMWRTGRMGFWNHDIPTLKEECSPPIWLPKSNLSPNSRMPSSKYFGNLTPVIFAAGNPPFGFAGLQEAIVTCVPLVRAQIWRVMGLISEWWGYISKKRSLFFPGNNWNNFCGGNSIVGCARNYRSWGFTFLNNLKNWLQKSLEISWFVTDRKMAFDQGFRLLPDRGNKGEHPKGQKSEHMRSYFSLPPKKHEIRVRIPEKCPHPFQYHQAVFNYFSPEATKANGLKTPFPTLLSS